MIQTALDAKALSDVMVAGLQEIKGRNILRMDLRRLSGAITDFFVICTGTSDTHVQALAESAMKFAAQKGERPISKEGFQQGEWVLLDFGNVIVHVFQQDKREFYRLEKLWGDAAFEEIAD
jgi:ribosome-associated protein